MPRLVNAPPKHRASGPAVVTIAGRERYLEPHGTKSSRIESDRLITKWLATGRPTLSATSQPELTVAEPIVRYWQFASQHDRKRGRGTSELDNVRHALRPLKELYGRTALAEFGPLALKAIQVRMIEDGLSRGVMTPRTKTQKTRTRTKTQTLT